ncbi:hypothetical protein C8R47DRAFT_1073936, partial [Mycena vitilis]
MPSLTLKSGVVFFYTDSGTVPGSNDYKTLVMIHGHTFHSGTFQRLNPLAQPNSLRIISVNRREYPGSSPYSTEELRIFSEGDDAERASLLEQQGRDLAMFIYQLIIELPIPKTGGIAIIAWSLGGLFLLSLIAVVETLPAAVRQQLTAFVQTVVLLRSYSAIVSCFLLRPHFRVPFSCSRLPTPSDWLIPHTDPAIAPEARGIVFAKWVSAHFVHGDLSTHDINILTYNNTDPLKVSTFETLKPEELAEMTDLGPADKYDNIIALFLGKQAKRCFDVTVRRAWSGTRFWNIYGSAEPWPVLYGAWFLEDKSGALHNPELSINCKVIDGSNHFLVWEDPAKAIDELKKFASGSQFEGRYNQVTVAGLGNGKLGTAGNQINETVRLNPGSTALRLTQCIQVDARNLKFSRFSQPNPRGKTLGTFIVELSLNGFGGTAWNPTWIAPTGLKSITSAILAQAGLLYGIGIVQAWLYVQWWWQNDGWSVKAPRFGVIQEDLIWSDSLQLLAN